MMMTRQMTMYVSMAKKIEAGYNNVSRVPPLMMMMMKKKKPLLMMHLLMMETYRLPKQSLKQMIQEKTAPLLKMPMPTPQMVPTTLDRTT